jgi:hypothetical protein
MIRKRMISNSNVLNLVDGKTDVPFTVTSPDRSVYPFLFYKITSTSLDVINKKDSSAEPD